MWGGRHKGEMVVNDIAGEWPTGCHGDLVTADALTNRQDPAVAGTTTRTVVYIIGRSTDTAATEDVEVSKYHHFHNLVALTPTEVLMRCRLQSASCRKELCCWRTFPLHNLHSLHSLPLSFQKQSRSENEHCTMIHESRVTKEV